MKADTSSSRLIDHRGDDEDRMQHYIYIYKYIQYIHNIRFMSRITVEKLFLSSFFLLHVIFNIFHLTSQPFTRSFPSLATKRLNELFA